MIGKSSHRWWKVYSTHFHKDVCCVCVCGTSVSMYGVCTVQLTQITIQSSGLSRSVILICPSDVYVVVYDMQDIVM